MQKVLTHPPRRMLLLPCTVSHDFPFQRSTSLNCPPTYILFLYMASARTLLLKPLPKLFHVVSFHTAIYLARVVSAMVNLPPAIKLPLYTANELIGPLSVLTLFHSVSFQYINL